MSRHVKHYCKIAGSSDGMEKLLEHTIQRQLAAVQAQNAEMKAQNAEMKAQMAELTTMLKGQVALTQTTAAPSPTVVINNAPVTTNNVTNTITQTVNIRPWGRGPSDHVVIPASMLRAAFTDNPRLAEYCGMPDEEKVDAEQAAPYVVEALVDLVKRAHADPAARNVYLNPRRADQVLVFDEATWKVLSLVEAIGALFDSVAGNIHRIIVSDRERAELPFEVQASASWMPSLYKAEPERFVAQARPQVAAHLTNMAPADGEAPTRLATQL